MAENSIISLCWSCVTDMTACSKNIKWYPASSQLYRLSLIALINVCFPMSESK